MAEWWKRHENVDIRSYSRDEIEDTTGCIPLLLDKCVVDGKIDLNVTDLRNICGKARHFVTEMRKFAKGDPTTWKTYVRFIRLSEHH
jgi:hypothetical protein